MKLLNVVQYPDPKLLEISLPVTKFDQELFTLIDDMVYTCQQTENCVGLAAIQVGIPLRLSVIKLKNKFIHIINPEIVYSSKEMIYDWEGCMSVGIGDDQLFSKIQREDKITVKYFDRYQKLITRACKGFVAAMFQHEIDHMNGVLFLSHVDDPSKIWKDKDLNVYIKKYNKLPL